MQIGDTILEPVSDGRLLARPTNLYTNPEGDWLPHSRFLDERGLVEMEMGGFLVRTGDRVVLVDTGIGPHSIPRRTGMFMESLAGRGVAAADVTDVVLTHLHFDHVGWATRHGEVVFQNATYRCDARDWAHFVGPDPGATKKLRPLESRLDLWDGSGRLLPGIDTMAAPGHTPGSTVLVLSSGTQRAMLLGDVVHCPVELIDDEWAGMADVDPDLALRTRIALARELEGTDTPIAAAHFPGLRFGRLLPGEGRRSWVIG